MTGEYFTPEQLAEIHAYHRPQYVELALHPFYSLAGLLLVAFVLNRPLYRGAERLAAGLAPVGRRVAQVPGLRVFPQLCARLWGQPGSGAALLYMLGVFSTYALLAFPGHLFFEFFWAHRFGMSRESFAHFLGDQAKSLGISAVCFSALGFGVFGLARRLPRWWLALGGVCAGLLLVSPFLDPYRARLYYAQAPLPDSPLRTAITRLLGEARVEFENVVVEKTAATGAFVDGYFAGQGATRSIVLNDEMVSQFSTDEVLAAVAHEAGHVHQSRWLRKLAASLALVMFLGLVQAMLALAGRRRWLGVESSSDIRALPLVQLLFFLLVSLVGPVSAADSRRTEADADRFALDVTRRPVAYASMLAKAARLNKMDPEPPRWAHFLYGGHPTIAERIALAESWPASLPNPLLP